MKTTLNKMSRKVAFLGMILAAANVAMAQTSSVTTTTTSAGTVREFTPNSFTVATTTSPAPVRYTYSKSTTYVDENGNPVSVETVRSGLPVTVYYDRNGDNLTATKVVVRKSVDTSPDGTTSSQTTTTTSSQGLVSSFTPDSAITIKSDTSPQPVSYTFTKTTTYVDQNGNPVSVDTVKSGVPVTVYYDRNGDQMVANRVVVQTDPNAQVIEHKKTTTTTTDTTPNP
jgi:hypothetical protein